MSSTRILALSTLAILASIRTKVAALDLSPAESSEAVNNLSAYIATLTTASDYAAANSVLATAVPSAEQSRLAENPGAYLSSVIAGGVAPTWYTAMPTSVQSYLESIGMHEVSIITEADNGASTTPAPVNNLGEPYSYTYTISCSRDHLGDPCILNTTVIVTTPTLTMDSSTAAAPTNAAKLAGVVLGAGGVILAAM